MMRTRAAAMLRGAAQRSAVKPCGHAVACPCAAHLNTARRHLSTALSTSSFSSSSRLSSSRPVLSSGLAHRQSAVAPLFPHSRTFASYPDHILLTMPALSPTMEKGNIAQWLKKVGDEVKVGESMADVETDKATVAFEAVEEGFMAKILIQDGAQDVIVGTPVAVLAENKEDIDKFKDFEGDGKGGGSAAKPAPKEDKPEASSSSKPKEADAGGEKEEQSPDDLGKGREGGPAPTGTSSGGSGQTGGRVIASPAAKRIAGEKGVTLDGMKGTGPDGRILSADVNEAIEAGTTSKAAAKVPAAAAAAPAKGAAAPAKGAAASSAGDFTDITHTNVRKVIASRLLQSKQTIPHYYLTSEVHMDALMKLRADLNARSAMGGDGVKLSVNDFIVKAAALACQKVPEANSSWQDNAIRRFHYVDMSVAVSTDSGLITPVIKDADIKGLSAISSETKELATRARAGKLQPAEYQGGTFTISNLGMFGVTQFAAIINPPQAAILAVGGTTGKVVKAGAEYKEVQVMNVTLSCDHRVVDGAVGAQWLQAFKGFVENPVTMLL